MSTRKYQSDMKSDIYGAFDAGARNVLSVLPTGAGKTVVFAEIMAEHRGAALAIAHRQELVAQISGKLNDRQVAHRIIAPTAVVREIVRQHGPQSYFDPAARCGVAGVDTLVRRKDALGSWGKQVTLWVQDEAHHVLRANKWGTAAALFPNARGLGVTATPARADGRGLGRHADGVFDCMLIGPSMRDLIDQGYLCDYRIWAPPSGIDLSGARVGSTGDYTRQTITQAVQRSRVIGDVVEHYQRLAPGRLGITFAPDVETAGQIAEQFRAAGVPAETISARTPHRERADTLRRFRTRETLQLVNVDIFGEGFDLPELEVVSFARPTASYGLYAQQFGRGCRPGKPYATIIDHVGNVIRHGLPDADRAWSLDARTKRAVATDGEIPLTACPACTGVYERTHRICPYCGHAPAPTARSGPEWVDGDLSELDAGVLADMRAGIRRVDVPVDVFRARLDGAPAPVQGGATRRHRERQSAQADLRESIAWWAGYQRAAGRDDRESYRRFWHTFGVDVLSAQALGRPDAEALNERVKSEIG